MFENTVLRGICGPTTEEVTGEFRKLCKEELNDLYCSPNLVWVIRWRMSWAGHVARMGERRGVYRDFMGKTEGNRSLGDPGVDDMILLRWILRK